MPRPTTAAARRSGSGGIPVRPVLLGFFAAVAVALLHSAASSTAAAEDVPTPAATPRPATAPPPAIESASVPSVTAAPRRPRPTPVPGPTAPKKPATPPPTLPWLLPLVAPVQQRAAFPHLAEGDPQTNTSSSGPVVLPLADFVAAPDDDGAVAAAVRRADSLLLRAMDDTNTKLTPAMREKLKRAALEQRRKAEDTLDVLGGGVPFTAPTPEQLERVSPPPRDDVCYVVLTGNNSHATRVEGLFATLAEHGRRRHRVVWISDVPDARIRPVVLRSQFEDTVCRDGLAEETQMKGCRYQRNFYRALDALQVVADAVIDVKRSSPAAPESTVASDTNETSRAEVRRNFRDCRWFVKLSDDTAVIREHLEWLLNASGIDADRDAAIIGKVERRNGYQFLSGGQPVIFTRSALRRWGGADAQRCEGDVIDHAPPKLQKFWWWADDVLTSFCWQHRGYDLRDLPGAVSVTRWRLAPIPPRLWTRVLPLPRANTTDHARAAPAHHREAVLPVSYHTYPYATPRQMFSLWHALHTG